MTYRITATVKANGEWKGFFSDYMNSLPLSTIQATFPDMTEAEWTAAKTEIIDYVKGRSSLPGVISCTETIPEDGNGSTQVWEWADEEAYVEWKNLPIHLEMAEKYDLSFVLAKRVVDASLKEHFTLPGVMENALLGRHLMGLYHIENDTIQTITEETI